MTTPADNARERDTRSRARWAAAVSASLSIVLVSSLAFVSSFDAGSSSATDSPEPALEPRSASVVPQSEAPDTDRVAGTQRGSDGSVGAAVAAATASSSSPVLATKSSVPRGGMTILRAPATGAVVVNKRSLRAPPNRRLKPSVDERNCPVKGSQQVTIDSYPPGATLYINHKDCGAIGTTPWEGKLPPSQGTATGTFTVIFERPGEGPIMKQFAVLKSTRIQRLEVPMP